MIAMTKKEIVAELFIISWTRRAVGHGEMGAMRVDRFSCREPLDAVLFASAGSAGAESPVEATSIPVNLVSAAVHECSPG